MKPRTLLLPLALLALGHTAKAQCAPAKTSIAPKSGANGIRFGGSVDMDAGTLLVGSPLDNEGPGGIEAGSVQALPRTGSGNFLTGWRLAPTTTAGDHFGCAVGVSGADGIVGADGDNVGGTDSGAAWLLHRVLVGVKPTWSVGAKLKAPIVQPGARFGASVAIATRAATGENVVAVGAPGENRVYVFEDDGKGQWVVTKTLAVPGEFGASLAMNSSRLVVGAPQHMKPRGILIFYYFGAAFVYSTSTWNQLYELEASFADHIPGYGQSVAISPSGRFAVGSPLDGFGAVHVFNGPSWAQVLHGTTSATIHPFGSSVAFDDAPAFGTDRMVVGEGAANRVHVYSCIATTSTELIQIQACGGACGFGAAVATEGGLAVAGAPGLDRVFVFEPKDVCESYCAAGTSASGCRAVLSGMGTPSVSAASGFDLNASFVEGAKDGLFFFGNSGRQNNPWGNGSSFQCVVPPVTRAGLLSGNGTADACDGWFSQDLNALWCPSCPKSQKNPGAGAVVQAQLWYRDPQNTSNQSTSLSDALEFTVQP